MHNIIISPDTTFVFDLHGVIFRLSTTKVVKELVNSPYKIKLFSTILYPKVILNTYFSLKNGAIAEEVLLKLANDFPQFEKLVSTGFNVINAQKPIWSTIELIRNLKIHGYKVLIFSNIGEKSMEILQDKFPDIFGYFDGVLSSTCKDNYLKKPNPKAFEKCLNFFKQNKSNLIFIDDKIKNIEIANQLGIQSILFKNAQDLHNKLIEIKVFV